MPIRLPGCVTSSSYSFMRSSPRLAKPGGRRIRVWAGKWHLPAPFPGAFVPGGEPNPPRKDRGFEFLPFQMQERTQQPFGDFTDEPVARAADAFLHREHRKPFFLGVSLHNPHDICYWVMDKLAPGHPSRAELSAPVSTLPPLPQNHGRSSDEPEFIAMCRQRTYYGPENTFTTGWDDLHWRRYFMPTTA